MVEKPSAEIDALKNDVRSMSSKIDLIIQKINTMEKNEQVLGRTLVSLNDRIKKLEAQGPASASAASAQSVSDFKEFDKKYATKQEIQEIKYTLDMVNPLEFATMDRVKEMISDALKKKG